MFLFNSCWLKECIHENITYDINDQIAQNQLKFILKTLEYKKRIYKRIDY